MPISGAMGEALWPQRLFACRPAPNGGYLRTGRGSAPVPNVVRSRAVKCGFLFLGCCHARSGPGMGWAANDGAVRPALRLLGRLTVRFLEPARVVGKRWQTGKWGLYRHEQLRC